MVEFPHSIAYLSYPNSEELLQDSSETRHTDFPWLHERFPVLIPIIFSMHKLWSDVKRKILSGGVWQSSKEWQFVSFAVLFCQVGVGFGVVDEAFVYGVEFQAAACAH